MLCNPIIWMGPSYSPFSIFMYVFYALFYHYEQEQISRHLTLHDWMSNERWAWLAARLQMFVGHLIAWFVSAYLLLLTVISTVLCSHRRQCVPQKAAPNAILSLERTTTIACCTTLGKRHRL